FVNYALCTCLKAQGKDEEAITYLNRGCQVETDYVVVQQMIERVAETPADASLRYDLGMRYLQRGQEGEAVHWLQSALQVDPKHALSLAALAAHQRQADRRQR